jgi:DNA-directed RNA polymerase subunit K/omega
MPLTKYERVRLIGSRASVLASGAARPLVQLPGLLDPLITAQEEFRLGLLRSVVVRVTPDGERQRYDCSALSQTTTGPSPIQSSSSGSHPKS